MLFHIIFNVFQFLQMKADFRLSHSFLDQKFLLCFFILLFRIIQSCLSGIDLRPSALDLCTSAVYLCLCIFQFLFSIRILFFGIVQLLFPVFIFLFCFSQLFICLTDHTVITDFFLCRSNLFDLVRFLFDQICISIRIALQVFSSINQNISFRIYIQQKYFRLYDHQTFHPAGSNR